MPDSKKDILLISYVFPPYFGIGGRRWARHAQQLANFGYRVHVICARNPYKRDSLWNDYVKNEKNISVHILPRYYPKSLLINDLNFFQKIAYKFWMSVLPLTTKRNYFDRTIFWKNVLLKKAESLIKENNIEHIICSGGPFGSMYYATLLKKKFPDLFILNDLRDPWTWAPNWGFPGLSESRMRVEKEMEKMTVFNSNVITIPTESLKNELSERYPDYADKFKVIPHFFDDAEISDGPKSKGDKIRLMIYGSIYSGSETYLKKIAGVLQKHRGKFSLDVYTDNHLTKSIFGSAENVVFHEPVTPKKLFERFKDVDHVILLQPPYAKNAISTKFYEIIYSRTPIIILSEKGKASEFILENKLGQHATIDGLEELFEKTIASNGNGEYNSNFDLSPYTLANVTRSIESILSGDVH